MKRQIKPISEEERLLLLKKSVWGLSVRPGEAGKTPDEIKKAFYAAFLDRERSLLASINRAVGELNQIFADMAGEGEGSVILNEGSGSRASGKNATAAGTGTVADCEGMLTAGRYNRPMDGDVLFCLGCGSDDQHRDSGMWVEMVNGEPRLYFRGGEYLSEDLLSFLAELATGSFLLKETSLEAASVFAGEDVEAKGSVRGKRVEAEEVVHGKTVTAEDTVIGETVEGKETVRGKRIEASETVTGERIRGKEVAAEASVTAKEEMRSPRIVCRRVEWTGEDECAPISMSLEEREGSRALVMNAAEIYVEYGEEGAFLSELMEEHLSRKKTKKRRNK